MAIRLTDIRTGAQDYAELDDKLLVLDFQAGQPQAFVEIHRRYGALAKHICRRFLVNTADVDEAVQETMIRVFQGLFRFNGQFALQPWIARIATNVSLDQIRARARRPQSDDGMLEEPERADPSDGPEELVERLLERDLVLSVLADLPETHRTALVLRELEGRSHREIAETMGITPAQAKALIHRAKGSFRRTWLVKMTERGGLAGMALAPLLLLFQVASSAKKLGVRAIHVGQVAQVATTELVATTAASSAPVATGLTERALAAGMTLLLAGGVTVGVSVVKGRDHDPIQRAAPVVVAAPEPESSPTPRPERTTEPAAPERDPRGSHPPVGAPILEPTPEPTPEPTDAPSGEPTTEPTDAPSGDPTATPTDDPTTVPVGPAPPLAFDFQTGTTSLESCACDTATRQVAAHVDGSIASGVTFTQSIEGAASDAQGDAAWDLSLDLSGAAGPNGVGSVKIAFLLGSQAGPFTYSGTAGLAEARMLDNGAVVYRFSGSFSISSGTEVPAGLPNTGPVAVSVGVWPDNTIFSTSVELS